MTQKAVVHSILLILATLLILLWVTNPHLSVYNLQLTAILMLILVATRYWIKPNSFRLAESIISTMAVLLVINDTGGLSSPLFFLNLFLLFELSLLLEPIIPLILSADLILFYLFMIPPGRDLSVFAIFLAFPFMTPLAIFLGKTYIKEENQKKEIKNLTQRVRTLKATA